MNHFWNWVWPGLPALWREGSWLGLWTALGYAAVLNLAVFSHFIFPGVFGFVGALSVFSLWLAYLLAAQRFAIVTDPAIPTDETWNHQGSLPLFRQAQGEYLQGNWMPAARLLEQVLRVDTGHIPARLMLVSVLQHMNRLDDSQRRLEEIASQDSGRVWQFEIERLRMRLAQRREPGMINRANAMPTPKAA